MLAALVSLVVISDWQCFWLRATSVSWQCQRAKKAILTYPVTGDAMLVRVCCGLFGAPQSADQLYLCAR